MPGMMPSYTPRRQVLRGGAAGLLILKPQTVFGSQANSSVELGLIGCGGRGNWIAPFFTGYTGARIVALGDVLGENLERTQQRFKVESRRAHLGFAAFREVIHSKVDAVVLETPPQYFPEMVAEAVISGKHVFFAKPVAVDVPGSLSILESGERARGKVSFLVDFQLRVRPVFLEAAARYRRGDIGQTLLGQVYYHSTSIRPRPVGGLSPGAAMMRNWYFYRALAGDTIVSRDIHVIDGANFYLQAHPEKAYGSGGRTARKEIGDTWDRFLVSYWYPNGIQVDFCSTEFAVGLNDMCVRFLGSAGTVESHYGGAVGILGPNRWQGAERDDTFSGGAITNVKNFIESIRSGNLLNNAKESVESNLTCILGRMAAHQGRMITWDEMLRSSETYRADLKI